MTGQTAGIACVVIRFRTISNAFFRPGVTALFVAPALDTVGRTISLTANALSMTFATGLLKKFTSFRERTVKVLPSLD